ncbi:MAG: hypothetical protein COB04_17980 [Gammaproteobacteria bacterium]|nr:MAG: hypothetical protein COB04_17980 [Gammaproteobacteria bacterium]
MKYIDVEWMHEFEDEPFRLISEIGDDHFETRKLALFRNGQFGFASAQYHAENTMLGTVEAPSLEEINTDKEFQGKNISKQAFELLWQEYVSAASEQ